MDYSPRDGMGQAIPPSLASQAPGPICMEINCNTRVELKSSAGMWRCPQHQVEIPNRAGISPATRSPYHCPVCRGELDEVIAAEPNGIHPKCELDNSGLTEWLVAISNIGKVFPDFKVEGVA